MADVLIVCVREDEAQAKTLADMFEGAGFSVGGAPSNDAALRSSGAGIVVWSQASIRSRPFLDAAQRVINAGKGVLACLIEPPPPESVNDSPAFDLTRWAGDANDPSLDPLFFAVDRMVNTARASVGAGTHAEPEAYEPPQSLRAPAREETPYPRPRQQRPEVTVPPAYQARPSSARASNFDGSANDPLGSEAEHWRAIRHSKDPTAFLDYLARYGPEGAFAELAEFRLKQLEGTPTNLRSAARQVEPPREPPAARRPEPRYDPPPPRQAPRAYEPPPPRRAEPPPPRAYEPAPPPVRRPDPPPQRRRDTNFDHRSPVDAPPEPPRSGGGFLRLLVLLVLLGGGAVAAGIYFGVGDQLQAMTSSGHSAQQQTAQNGEEPASAQVTESASAGTNEIPDAQVLDTVTPSGVVSMSQAAQAQRNHPVQVASNNAPRRAPPAPARQQPQPVEDGPTPAPSVSWNNAAPASPQSGGPASLLPGASVPSVMVPVNVPQQYASNATAPTVSTSTSVAAAAAMVRWTARPTGQRMAALYPANALRQNIGGSAQLDCVVRADLGVTCSVASEGPANAGFGRAALASVNFYRAAPTLSDGSSAIGARTRIAITFRAPQN